MLPRGFMVWGVQGEPLPLSLIPLVVVSKSLRYKNLPKSLTLRGHGVPLEQLIPSESPASPPLPMCIVYKNRIIQGQFGCV